MGYRFRPWLALLVSAMVHLGIALVLTGQPNRSGGGEAGAGAGVAQPGRLVVLTLVGPDRPAAAEAATVPNPAAAEAPEALPARSQAALARATRGAAGDAGANSADAGTPGTEGSKAEERRYFGVGETTRQAVVASGLAADEILVVPGMAPQDVAIQVWISDEGMVDRVELESPLSEKEQQLLLAAFAKVRFHPGRIGRIAVRSRLSMRIVIDYTLRA